MLIYGNGGFATQLIYNLCEVDAKYSLKDLVIFSNPKFKISNNYLSRSKSISDNESIEEIFNNYAKDFIIAFAKPNNRQIVHKFLTSIGGVASQFISSRSLVSSQSNIGPGTLILMNSIVEPNCMISENCILNVSVKIFHDCSIGNYTEIGPNSLILGGCSIGNSCIIGANSTILPKVNICNDVIIGANSTVTKNIVDPGTYVGTPATKSA